MNEPHPCPICSSSSVFLGAQRGRLGDRDYFIRRCNACHYAYVENHRTDFENVYNENYYHGTGADPTVDYAYELQQPSKTIRNYEWKAIYSIYRALCPSGGRWLDYGCGAGGLVRFAIEHGVDATGFDEGWAADKGRLAGIPIIRSIELEKHAKAFDFISAVEVFEHLSKPLETLLQIRRLLKPGGILFLTTGNAQPWRENLLAWDYTKCPDAHISFYEPETLARGMQMAGFCPKEFSSFNGFIGIIKFKVLKAFKIRNQSKLIDILPWSVISKIVDGRCKVSKQPYGVAIGD